MRRAFWMAGAFAHTPAVFRHIVRHSGLAQGQTLPYPARSDGIMCMTPVRKPLLSPFSVLRLCWVSSSFLGFFWVLMFCVVRSPLDAAILAVCPHSLPICLDSFSAVRGRNTPALFGSG